LSLQIDICNRALIRLAAPTIASIDDNTKSAKLCKKLYDSIVEEVHGEGPWSNAVKRVSLAKLTSTPAFGFTTEYQLPNDLVKVITINDTEPGDQTFKIENDKLLIDSGSVKIQYIALLSTPGSFGTYMTSSITDLMTAELSYAFTGSSQIAAGLKQQYMANLKDNLAKDNQQGSKDIIYARDFIEVR
jgi:hypothetical protein